MSKTQLILFGFVIRSDQATKVFLKLSHGVHRSRMEGQKVTGTKQKQADNKHGGGSTEKNHFKKSTAWMNEIKWRIKKERKTRFII